MAAWFDADVTTAAPARLSAADRCDQCGAQAYLRVVLNSGDLLFCAHHGREHMPALQAQAIEIHDFTDQLTKAGVDD